MKIAIIGAGPAGLLAAIASKNDDNQVVILEKNEKIGKKLFITGKGRCNITNYKPMREIMDQVVTNKKFLYSAFNSFTNEDIIRLLNENGLETKIERGDRVFPSSDKSSDVIKCFEKICRNKKIDIRLNSLVSYIEKRGEKFRIYSTHGLLEEADRLILACGGRSYPSTGSTGDGHKFAAYFGHKIVSPKPGLVPILINDQDLAGLGGISLKNISLNFKLKNKKYNFFGELLFTGKGISGPVVLTASSYINKNPEQVKDMHIDMKTALDYETLDRRFIKEFEVNPNKQISTILESLTLKALIPIILDRLGIEKEKKAHQISKKERANLVEIFKHFNLDFQALMDIKYAIITSGGLSVKEINPSTMESKLVKGLYFAGEMIDVDALTGGYNLQIAYSTGYLAGQNARDGGKDV
ncbi:MAG: NAD(P)/FAD-dependent oxidoreductase [Tissierellia bacterium]|nr:NAD(P)/FAD-dependent oxidoreductase [Tissierellia bacterium]